MNVNDFMEELKENLDTSFEWITTTSGAIRCFRTEGLSDTDEMVEYFCPITYLVLKKKRRTFLPSCYNTAGKYISLSVSDCAEIAIAADNTEADRKDFTKTRGSLLEILSPKDSNIPIGVTDHLLIEVGVEIPS